MSHKSENYTSLITMGLLLTVLIVAGLSYSGFLEPRRLAQAQEESTQERITRGKGIYTQQCASCHGAQGEGGVGPALNNAILLKNTYDSALFSVIRSGVPNTRMPAWGIEFGGPLTDEDIRDAVAFIRNWEDTAPEVKAVSPAPDPARGALLFASTCAICHGESGQGGTAAPKLNDPARLQAFPDDWYRATIRNGRPAKGMPTWGTVLSPGQVDDLVALIAAWREGQQVRAGFSLNTSLDSAIFSLQNGDTASTALHIQHALEVAQGAQQDLLRSAAAKLAANNTPGALADLQAMQAGSAGDATLGAKSYTANCAACHGPQGEGGTGKSFQHSAFINNQSDTQLLDLVLAGRPGTAMAGFQGRVTEAEIKNIIALIRLWNP
jgi:mono/diheme cytochrome c family protein